MVPDPGIEEDWGLLGRSISTSNQGELNLSAPKKRAVLSRARIGKVSNWKKRDEFKKNRDQRGDGEESHAATLYRSSHEYEPSVKPEGVVEEGGGLQVLKSRK